MGERRLKRAEKDENGLFGAEGQFSLNLHDFMSRMDYLTY